MYILSDFFKDSYLQAEVLRSAEKGAGRTHLDFASKFQDALSLI